MIINGSGAGGTGSDECTARLSDIPAGLKAVTADSNDEAGVGTMTMTGNAQAAHVLAGETFYTNNYKTKLIGTMTVNSLLSFSVAAYSGRRVLAKWQNPKAASGKPYSGVYIRYSTSGNPGKTGGTQIYKGAGNNTASEGQSQAYLDLPALSTKYYLSIYPYVTCSAGEMTGAVINATVTTGSDLWLTFTKSQNYTVPGGYTKAVGFAVGGGGSGAVSRTQNSGGGSGYTATSGEKGITVGQVLTVTVGAGGAAVSSGNGNDGGSSSISGIISAGGGRGGGIGGSSAADMRSSTNCNGGSGGGETNQNTGSGADMPAYKGGNGGSNGGNGQVSYNRHTYQGCRGQGSNTRAWGSSTGTLYAGGGAAGDSASGGYGGSAQATGGSGGGGNGALGNTYTDKQKAPSSGATNTGGGGGGGYNTTYNSAAGGSGIVLLHLY